MSEITQVGYSRKHHSSEGCATVWLSSQEKNEVEDERDVWRLEDTSESSEGIKRKTQSMKEGME